MPVSGYGNPRSRDSSKDNKSSEIQIFSISNSVEECKIIAKVCDHNIKALVDTGSTSCLVGPELFDVVPELKFDVNSLMQPALAETINGDKIPLSKKVTLKWEVKRFPSPLFIRNNYDIL